ncbi:hypothetical protein AGLY_012569 [Aphis glycines]|uniref:Uncharacterized protein n=1 Tax=Aphis glycines TaxID=307491 RepID=A0A6G0T8R9_APHGL|nr:hypothetical protein AGLY_012569 [Aphis glycines]
MEQPSVSSRTYQLLDMSDSGSSSSAHVPPLILTSPRKKRYRKFGNNRDKFGEKVTFEKCRLQSRTVCVFFVLSVLIVWLLTMSWFINALQNELDKFNHTIITNEEQFVVCRYRFSRVYMVNILYRNGRIVLVDLYRSYEENGKDSHYRLKLGAINKHFIQTHRQVKAFSRENTSITKARGFSYATGGGGKLQTIDQTACTYCSTHYPIGGDSSSIVQVLAFTAAVDGTRDHEKLDVNLITLLLMLLLLLVVYTCKSDSTVKTIISRHSLVHPYYTHQSSHIHQQRPNRRLP